MFEKSFKKMSISQKIALEVIDEPEIIEISPDGTEQTRIAPTEEQNFLQVWNTNHMKLENFSKTETKSIQQENMDAKHNAALHLQYAKNSLQAALQVLKNTVLTAQPPDQGDFNIDHITKSEEDFQSMNMNDMVLGSRIVDKQMQLQSSSDKLFDSAVKLRKVVDNSKKFFRKLETLQKKVHLNYRENIQFISSTNSFEQTFPVITVENPVRNPFSTSGICLRYDSENDKLDWSFSNDLRFLIDGKTYNPRTDSNFINFNCILLQENLFKHIQSEASNILDNYSTSEASQTIHTANHVFQQSVFHNEDDDALCPIWLPALVESSIPPKSLPLKKFRSCIDHFDVYNHIYDLIKTRFMHTSICTVSITHKNHYATFKIASIFSPHVAVVVLGGTKLTLSTPTHLRQTFSLEMSKQASEHKLIHWIDVTWFIMFSHVVEAIAVKYGLNVERKKNQITVNCHDRIVTFEATKLANETSILIQKNGEPNQTFLLGYVPGHSIELKLIFLFLGN